MTNRPTYSQRRLPNHSPTGFTLVEMMVATTLVVIMMLMFAQVFQTASGLVSNQKGMAENDQKVRTVTTLLRGDIKQRTFVDVVPYVPNQNTENDTVPKYDVKKRKGFDHANRQGFFSISENDPNNPADDVLHLTISTTKLVGKSRLPYSGKTRLLRILGEPPANDDQYLQEHPDQPEFDDGQNTVNNTGSSPVAEVCWFLRNGTLYRRMLLIRSPYYRGANADGSVAPNEPSDTPDPNISGDTPQPFIPTFYDHDSDGSADDFWRDFDYSAYWDSSIGELKFHTVPESLGNKSGDPTIGTTPATLKGPISLGNPIFRFGSSLNRRRFNGTTYDIYGPREYIVDANDGSTKFIGRFTLQETADSTFQYPGYATTAVDPFAFDTATTPINPNSSPTGRTFSLDPDTGLVAPYDNETNRRGEDVMLTNVHEFDIQVWDEAIGAFVNLGHSQDAPNGNPGWFHQARNLNTSFGQRGTTANGNSFDTWHPSADIGGNPPFAPYVSQDPAPPPGATPFDSRNPPPVAIEQDDRTSTNEYGLGANEEIWLKAIRIKIRFYDIGSEQMRDLSFTFRMNHSNSEED